MKLRHDKGEPRIILEEGDIAALKRVRGLLLSSATHLEGLPSVGTLRDTARELGIILEGSLMGVMLPKKRARKPESLPLPFDAEPGEQNEALVDDPNDPMTRKRCPKCKLPMTRSEAARGECYKCRPLVEGTA